MKKIHLLALPLLFSAAAVFAQNAPVNGISESTDPSKAAEVERRAQDLRSGQGSNGMGAMGDHGMRDHSMSGMEPKPRHGAHKKHHRKHHAARAEQQEESGSQSSGK
jgi:hypothetical protein